jgi:Prokaryotic cytochrome b561
MFALPLVGWAMLSAAAYPIALAGSLHLPPILPHSNALYALLRPLHTALAFLLFATFLIHLSAALIHALIFRDGVFQSMTSWRRWRAAVARRVCSGRWWVHRQARPHTHTIGADVTGTEDASASRDTDEPHIPRRPIQASVRATFEIEPQWKVPVQVWGY